jgi:hypothetical protein
LRDIFILGGYLTNLKLLESKDLKISNGDYFEYTCKEFIQLSKQQQDNKKSCFPSKLTDLNMKKKFKETKKITEEWLAYNASCELV